MILAACPPSSRRPVERQSGRPAEGAPPAGEPARTPTDKPRAAPASTPLATPPEQPRPEEKGRLAVVIDDAGYDLDELQPFLELPMPLAVAVLPNLPHSREAARRVLAAGKELLLHLPMEPEGRENPGPGALLTADSPEETRRLLDAALATVPGAVGMNNHMGSRATADEVLMTAS